MRLKSTPCEGALLRNCEIAMHFLSARKLSAGSCRAKPSAQSEPDITSAVADRAMKRGIADNGLIQKNAFNNSASSGAVPASLRAYGLLFCTPSGSKSRRLRRKMQK
jgi:hypothetical protein